MELSSSESDYQQKKEISPGNLNVQMNLEQIKNIQKKYKKIKKYMKSSLFAIKVMNGDETVVKKLLKELEDNPL